jgi:hypothetical protein
VEKEDVKEVEVACDEEEDVEEEDERQWRTGGGCRGRG